LREPLSALKVVSASPLEVSIVELVEVLSHVTLRSGVVVQDSRHVCLELAALAVVLLKDPVAALVAVLRVRHERIRTPTALVEPVTGESLIALADSLVANLGALAMAVAVLLPAVVFAQTSLLTEAIIVSEISVFAVGAVLAREMLVANALGV
jgi:hypothetical protein